MRIHHHVRLRLLIASLLVVGVLIPCLAASTKPPKRTPTSEVKLFRDGDLPSEAVKELAVYTDDGGLDEEEAIVRKFIQKAKKAGADVLVLEPLRSSGVEPKPFSFGAYRATYAYRAFAYYYDPTGEVLTPRTGLKRETLPPRAVDGSQPRSSGTGFFISEDGYLITNEHVVHGAGQVKVLTSTGMNAAKVILADPASDLALLKVQGEFHCLPIKPSRSVRLGETVATVGFPNPVLQGFSPKLAKGEIASLAGIQDDPKWFQVSLPVQPGNSGGALVDTSGNVIGVIVAKLGARAALISSGTLPENVNYAIKSSFLLGFLEACPDAANHIAEPVSSSQDAFEKVTERVQSASAMVLKY